MKNQLDKLKLLEQQISSLEEKIISLKDTVEKVIEVGTDGHWDWDMNADYEYMDPRFWEIFGYLPHEKAHHPSAWQNMIHPDDLQKTLNALDAHIKSKGKVPYFQEVRYKHKKGHWVTVICRGRVIEWNNDGSPKRMVGTHTDITHTKEAAKKLKN
jgi:PAS domain S-box-containing protein